MNALVDWRPDLQTLLPTYEARNTHGPLWWLRWGLINHPETQALAGLTTEFCADFIYKHTNKPPLYDWLKCSLLPEATNHEYLNTYFNHLYSDYVRRLVMEDTETRAQFKAWLARALADGSMISLHSKFKSLLDEIEQLTPRQHLISNHQLEVFGHPDVGIGISEDARLLKAALQTEQISKLTKSISNIPVRIFAYPAPNVLVCLSKSNLDFKVGYNIMSSHWELPKWPHSLEFILDHFDEIWVHSQFVYNSIDPKFHHKVKLYPDPIEDLGFRKTNAYRAQFGLDSSKFYFLIAYDYSSYVQRKNPEGMIKAFLEVKKEFDCGLIIKTMNANTYPELHEKVTRNLTGVPDVHVFKDSLPRPTLHQLYSSADCYLSLHRSEGFGRNIGEMMLLGVPCVITNFSGNLDFCNSKNSFLVDYDQIRLKQDDYIYAKDQYWADPKIEHAVFQMKTVLNADAVALRDVTDSARQTIQNNFSIQNTATFLQQRLSQIIHGTTELK